MLGSKRKGKSDDGRAANTRTDTLLQLDRMIDEWRTIRDVDFHDFASIMLEARALPPRFVLRQKQGYEAVNRIIAILTEARNTLADTKLPHPDKRIKDLVTGSEWTEARHILQQFKTLDGKVRGLDEPFSSSSKNGAGAS
jgi:hypothetical protein